jgi:hypothetical protein
MNAGGISVMHRELISKAHFQNEEAAKEHFGEDAEEKFEEAVKRILSKKDEKDKEQ